MNKIFYVRLNSTKFRFLLLILTFPILLLLLLIKVALLSVQLLRLPPNKLLY
jgi:hypothetical protein